MGPKPHLSFCASKRVWLAPEIIVSMGPSPHLLFIGAKLCLLGQNDKSLWVPVLICGLWMQNSDFWTRIASVYWSQMYPNALCMQNNVISTWNTSLYRSHPSSMVFACKTATFGPELQASMGSRLHLSYWECKTSYLASENLSLCDPVLIYGFWHAKQRLLDQNNKSPWVQDMTYRFVHVQQRA